MEQPDYERVSEVMRDYHIRAHRLVDRMMTASGASFARTRMLLQISREGVARSIDLAGAFGYAPRTVTEAIDGLERDGLVRRDPDPNDRRAKIISLTEAGRAAAAGAEESRRQYIASVYGVFSPEECERLVALVGKLNDRLAELGG